ncbi:MAG: TolC family protein, partial [Campylobacter sp.]|nr:TolC family protein [Campylobacter sp.]
ILILLCFICEIYGGNLAEIIALAQSAKRESLRDFNKNSSFDKAQNKRLNISFDGRYTFVPGSDGGYVTKSGAITAKIEYLLFDGGASDAANKILLYSGIEEIYKNEELANLTAFQIGKIYFNAVSLDALIALEMQYILAFTSLLDDAQFFYEYNEIDKSEFDALSVILKKRKEESDELNLKRVEL